MLDQHAERRSPVADVVLADDPVPDEREHAYQRVADHGAAQVPDVHLLGDVGRRVVDDHRLCCGCAVHAEAVVVGHGGELVSEEEIVERDVDEARSGHLDPGGDAREWVRVENLIRHLARVPTELLARGNAPFAWASA